MVDVRQKAILLVSGGMKQCEAARALGVAPQSVSRWVQGAEADAARAKQALGKRVRWPDHVYKLAMNLLGEGVPHRQVASRLGVPRTTVASWAAGRKPRIVWDKSRRLSEHELRKSRRLQSLRQYYRRAHRFHIEHNPDYDLAPLHHLWLPRLVVLGYIDANMPSTHAHLEGSTERRRLDQMRAAGRAWVRFDSVDKIFTRLDLSIHALCDPTYCPLTAGPPTEEEKAA